MDQCTKHAFEQAIDTCKECRHQFCPECLVWSHGPRRPPMCVPCALTAAGVRSNAARPAKMEARRRRFARA